MDAVTREDIEKAFEKCGIPAEWLDVTYPGKFLTNWELYLIGENNLSDIALAYLKDVPL